MTNSSVGFPQFYQIQQILDRFLDTIRKWVQAATVIAIDHQGTAVTNEQFKQLQKENRRLREELDILKRAAVLLAKRWIFIAAERPLFL
ncbi:hypothetical protein KG087_02540 [Lacticaseibacillus zeae]|uniref:hypothetical protein n=1 Tax=Lacticaseibacillus zeae TaxID=57037 RepID=UPI001BCDC48E|nr:hypothetical protein [Lacticaseibacillus zeae]QVI33536.1 hypothetical protein KG087_02540 [Lacticaseibacillus zeae]